MVFHISRLPGDVISLLEKTDKLFAWIISNVNGQKITGGDQVVYGATLLQHTIDLGSAILLLLRTDKSGPAFALARPQLESYVSSLWLLYHASDSEVERFKSGQGPKIASMIKRLDETKTDRIAWVKETGPPNLKTLNLLTHASVLHVHRRMESDTSIIPNYPPEEVINLIKLTAELQINATTDVLMLAENSEDWRTFALLVNEYHESA